LKSRDCGCNFYTLYKHNRDNIHQFYFIFFVEGNKLFINWQHFFFSINLISSFILTIIALLRTESPLKSSKVVLKETLKLKFPKALKPTTNAFHHHHLSILQNIQNF